jgi:four helix bundle protein
MTDNYNTFEDLLFLKKSKELAIIIYNIFKFNKDYWFKDQIQRAWISVSNNIAEWFERQTNKELKQFLYISKRSCWEVRNMIIIWKELWYISNDDFLNIYNLTIEISKMLSWYIKNIDI